ncbi:single stranded DNA-binding domain-containing protein [Natronorubrum halophilum]|uniref:hypothetical protein n=1 Tax=Natronorubrum halophilum TaxID=1702106 RepID=UPI000EF6ACC0|nr:hypothetical protein [Natronorubrum halophilum]
MFWILFRAMILATAGGLITLVAIVAADPLLETMFAVTTNPNSRNAFWADEAMTWLPAIVFGSIVIKVLAGAAVRRGAI